MIKTTLAAILPFLMLGSSIPNDDVVSKIDTTLASAETPIETPAEERVEIETV